MAVRPYAGTARPIVSTYEDDPAYRKVEVDEADASIARGYEHIATGTLLVMATMVVSPARQAALDAINAAAATEVTNKAQFLTDCETLFVKARAHAQNPGSNPSLTTREMNEAIARLFRLAQQIYKTT